MKISIITLSFVPLLSFAGEYETTIGLGHQYGGVLGAQFAYKTVSSKYYGALGLVGMSAGFQTTFSEKSKHTYGFVLGREELQSEDGFLFVTYDYHLDGFTNNGFVIGTGIGFTSEDSGGWWSDKGETNRSKSLTLNLGYKF